MTSNGTTSNTSFDIEAFRHRRAEGQVKWHETGERWVLSSEDLLAAYGAGEINFNFADLRAANLNHAELVGAQLGRANLYGAQIRAANLNRAELDSADLGRADLFGANLGHADLHAAYLFGANLGHADLGRANLFAAELYGASLNWNSPNLMAEILYRAADTDLLRQSFALLIRQHTEWCWNHWLSNNAPPSIEQVQWDTLVVAQREWALQELAKWVRDGDDAPESVRRLAAQKINGVASE